MSAFILARMAATVLVLMGVVCITLVAFYVRDVRNGFDLYRSDMMVSAVVLVFGVVALLCGVVTAAHAVSVVP